jgi:hypothetical protein
MDIKRIAEITIAILAAELVLGACRRAFGRQTRNT